MLLLPLVLDFVNTNITISIDQVVTVVTALGKLPIAGPLDTPHVIFLKALRGGSVVWSAELHTSMAQ